MKELELTREVLTALLGKDEVRTVAYWLDGERTLGVADAERLADALGLGFQDLFALNPTEQSWKQKVVRIASSVWRGLSGSAVLETFGRFSYYGGYLHFTPGPSRGFVHRYFTDGSRGHQFAEFELRPETRATGPVRYIFSVTLGKPHDGEFLCRYEYGEVTYDPSDGSVSLTSYWFPFSARARAADDGSIRVWTWFGVCAANFWVNAAVPFKMSVTPGLGCEPPAGPSVGDIVVFKPGLHHVRGAMTIIHSVPEPTVLAD